MTNLTPNCGVYSDKVISKGCTAVNTFKFPFAPESVSALYITYQQFNVTVLEYDLSQITFGEDSIIVYLSQEDTLRLDEKTPIHIQIRVKFYDGTANKSNTVVATTDEVLKDGVI